MRSEGTGQQQPAAGETLLPEEDDLAAVDPTFVGELITAVVELHIDPDTHTLDLERFAAHMDAAAQASSLMAACQAYALGAHKTRADLIALTFARRFAEARDDFLREPTKH